MLVWMKSSGPWIRRSTWDSAAKLRDRPRLVLGEQAGYQLAIADIAGDEGVPGVAVEAGEVLPVAGVGELVEADHRLVSAGPASRARNWRR